MLKNVIDTQRHQDLKRLLEHAVGNGAKIGFWGCTLIALIAAAPNLPLAVLLPFISGIGGNLIANILDRAAKGESISEDELRKILESDKLSSVQQIIDNKNISLEQRVQILATASELGNSTQQLVERLNLFQASLHSDIEEQTKTILNPTMATYAMIREMHQHMIVDKASPSVNVEEEKLSAKVTVARDILRSGHASVAKATLTAIRIEIAKKRVSDELLFRVATNLGACAYQLDDIPTAIKELQDAFQYRPEDPMALANAAVAASLSGDAELALSLSIKARSLEAKSSSATAIFIGTLKHLDRVTEIEQILRDEPWIETDTTCAMTLADMCFNEGRYKEAEKYCQTAIQSDDTNPLAHLLLSQIILIPLRRFIDEDMPLSGHNDGDVKSRLEKAELALSQAINLTEQFESPRLRRMAMANRSGVRARQGKLREAQEDCDHVIADGRIDDGTSSYDVALRNKGQMLMKEQKPTEAISFFKRIEDDQERMDSALVFALAYLQTSQPGKAIEIAKPVWQNTEDQFLKIEAADFLLSAYQKMGEPETIEQMISELYQEYPENPNALAAISAQRMREGKTEEAVALSQRAYNLSSGHAHDWVGLQLARYHFSQNKFAEAASYFRSLGNRAEENLIMSEFVYSLYKSGQNAEALEVATKTRDRGKAIPLVTEIEATLLEDIGDLNGATLLWEQLVEIEPQKSSHLLHLLLLELRRGDKVAAKQAIARIRYEAIKDDAEILLRLANIHVDLELPGVLKLAYRARQIAPGDAAIHSEYIQLSVRSSEGEKAFLPPTEVGIDSSVFLQRGTETLVFTILEEEPIHTERGELAPTDVRAMKLLGHNTGDRISLQEGLFGQQPFEIIDIQSKYFFAGQESQKMFQSGLFSDPSFFVGTVSSPDFKSAFLSSVDRLHQQGDFVMEMYRKKQIPLCMMARSINRSVLEVWRGLTAQHGERLFSATGTFAESQQQIETLSRQNILVLDLTALLTIHLLGNK